MEVIYVAGFAVLIGFIMIALIKNDQQ